MEHSIKLAEEHLDAGRSAAAVEILRLLKSDLPAVGVRLLADTLLRMGDSQESVAVIRRGLQRFPKNEDLWLAWIDAALREEQWAVAAARARRALGCLGKSPAVRLRAAQAYFGLGKVLGVAEVREVVDGRPGQFASGWLLVERRGPRRFLCCPEVSALNQLRRALDAGLDVPAAHLLHARIWQKAGKPQIGLALLESREAVLLESHDQAMLAAFAELALEADVLDDYLRYCQMRADCEPRRRAEILSKAYVAVAERYGQRGEEALYREFCYRALRLRPDDLKLMLHLAEAEWSDGRRDEATTLYRRVLEREPTHPRRRQMLERLASQAGGEPHNP